MKLVLGLWVMVVVLPACGGDAQNDGASATTGGPSGPGAGGGPAGSGGAGADGGAGATGGQAVGGAGASGGGGGAGGAGDQCKALQADMEAKLEAATVCNACQGLDACLMGPKLHDACGCEVGAASNLETEVAAAQMAYDAWVAAGCGPLECGKPCFTGAWGCMPNMGGDCGGHCAPL